MCSINSNSLTLMRIVSRRWKVMLTLAILMSTLMSVDAAAFKRDVNGEVKKVSPEPTALATAASNAISTAKPDPIVHHAEIHHNGTWETSAYNKNVTLDNDDGDDDDGGEDEDENADEISNSKAAAATPTAVSELDADKNDGDNNGNEEDDDDDDNNDDEQIYGENENYLDNYDDNENGEDDENPEFEEEDDGGAI